MSNPFTTKDQLVDIINQVVLGEKKLTDDELKKREEIAQAMERENPGMDMSKKMAIATAQAKKVAEEVEQKMLNAQQNLMVAKLLVMSCTSKKKSSRLMKSVILKKVK